MSAAEFEMQRQTAGWINEQTGDKATVQNVTCRNWAHRYTSLPILSYVRKVS